MATVSSEVRDQIETEKALALINSALDKLDAMLMMRGRDSDSMLHDYQDKLFRHREMLLELFTNKECVQKNHLKHLSQNGDFFKELIDAIKLVQEDIYEPVITSLKSTAASRIDYFTALRLSLPTGRRSYPEDVAWFHRQNPQLVAAYQKQHPSNVVLSMEEEDSIKKACDFKEFKFESANKIIQGSDFFRDRKPGFFQAEDAVKCQAANYLRYHLHESLISLANEISLNNLQQYQHALASLQKRLISDLPNLKAKDLSASIPLQEDAIKLVQKHTELVIQPLFQKINQEIDDEIQALVTSKEPNKLVISNS